MTHSLRDQYERASTSKIVATREIAKPYCIRLKASEVARLKWLAGRMTVSAFIRQQCLGEHVAPRRAVRVQSIDETLAARVLGALGQSRLASNINQIAKSMNLGAVPVDDTLRSDLSQACSDIRAMRNDLVVALGIKSQD